MSQDRSKTGLLALLGPWQLMLHGAMLALPRRDQRVIAAVALMGPQPRRQLAELLWPEKSSSRACANLRVNLSDIHRRCPGVLVPADQITLAPEVECDVTSARRLPSEVRQASTIGQLWQHLAFARGAQLLPGWFDAWLEDERDQVRSLRVSALEALHWRFLELGDADGALAAATLAAADDPFRETSVALVMRAHVVAGNHALALRVYERTRSLLEQELGVDPSPVLTSLATALRGGESAQQEMRAGTDSGSHLPRGPTRTASWPRVPEDHLPTGPAPASAWGPSLPRSPGGTA